jgi:hypothetical protein
MFSGQNKCKMLLQIPAESFCKSNNPFFILPLTPKRRVEEKPIGTSVDIQKIILEKYTGS